MGFRNNIIPLQVAQHQERYISRIRAYVAPEVHCQLSMRLYANGAALKRACTQHDNSGRRTALINNGYAGAKF